MSIFFLYYSVLCKNSSFNRTDRSNCMGSVATGRQRPS